MNREQKIEYLKKYRQEQRKIKSIELSLEELDTYILNISPKISKAKVQVTQDPDKLTELIAKKQRMIDSLNEQQAEALDTMAKVLKAIDTVNNQLHHAILVRKYISGASLEEIAEELNYEYSWTTRLHNSAIDSVKL